MTNIEPDFNQLKKLWTLKLVVDSGSLKRAAVHSKVSVSAVSQSLTALEKNLGRKLLLRRDRKLFPTEYCHQLLASAAPAFQACGEIQSIRACALAAAPPMAWLDFGVSECVAGEVLPAFVKEMKTKMPKMKLTLRVGRSRALTTMVKKGELCMSLVTENDATRTLSTYPIYTDRLGLYRRAEGTRLTLAGLPAGGIASLVPEAEGHPLYYSRFLRAIDTAFRPGLVSDSYETLYSIAASGAMAAILPARLAQRAPGLLQEIPVPSARADLGKFSVLMVSQATCDPAEDAFLLNELRSLF